MSRRPRTGFLVLAALATAALTLGLHRLLEPTSPSSPRIAEEPTAGDLPHVSTPLPSEPSPAAGQQATPRNASATRPDDAPWALDLPLGFDPDDPAAAWSKVDLESVRRALPDNRYWIDHVPSDDPTILAERKRAKAEWREKRTLVESGRASEEEVNAYFDHQRRVHADGIEFASYLIEHYGDVLPERDLGLLHIAKRLNAARLVELPRALARAQTRREDLDRARRAWREQQAAFGESSDASSLDE